MPLSALASLLPAAPDTSTSLPSDDLPPDFWQRLEREPHAHDFFHVLRWIDARGGAQHALGRGPLPRLEPVRVRQEPSMAFAPSTLAAARAPRPGEPAEISLFGFGLFGPNGPLPLHITEQARERAQHHGDRTLAAFADIFHHRLSLLFYRAWADAQSTVAMDRAEDRYTRYVGSLLHMGPSPRQRDDDIPGHAKRFMAGHLVRQTRNPEGLVQILSAYFDVPVTIREFVPQWIRLEPSQCMTLDGSSGLGSNVLGGAIRDAQHRFRIEIGPLRLAQYSEFLPGKQRPRQLMHWVREYVGIELAWDVRPLLDARDATGVSLGARRPLGLSSWLGSRPASRGPAAELTLDYEARAAHVSTATPTSAGTPYV